jgi:hypothetical protein
MAIGGRSAHFGGGDLSVRSGLGFHHHRLPY